MPAPNGKRAYLDYAATAPFDERLLPVLRSASWANANSLYAEGQEAARQLRDARARIARCLGAHAPSEIVFTSGGTEAINMAVKGMVRKLPSAHKTHVVVSSIEHHAVLHAVESLKALDYKVDMLDPDANGVVDPAKLDGLLARIEDAGDACALVCVQGVNNEIGTIQPVRMLADVAHARCALFFCDGVQALGKVEIDLETSGIDACAFSAHKIGAPKGVGALYVRRGTRIAPLLHGGGQEAGARSGTSNVPGACAFAQAVEYACDERLSTRDHVAKLKAHVIIELSKASHAHGVAPTLANDDVCVPHILSLLVDGLEGETVVLRCDNAGIALSSGSACSSSSLDPSHVIMALGVQRDRALGAVRLSFGRETTTEDVDRFIDALPEVLG